jgi:hypothetical protein
MEAVGGLTSVSQITVGYNNVVSIIVIDFAVLGI